MSSAKRVPTPDVAGLKAAYPKLQALIDGDRPVFASEIEDYLLILAATQRDQLQQAREIIDALNRLQHLSSGSAIIARLDPILEKAAAFKRANPAPAATKEHHGK